MNENAQNDDDLICGLIRRGEFKSAAEIIKKRILERPDNPSYTEALYIVMSNQNAYDEFMQFYMTEAKYINSHIFHFIMLSIIKQNNIQAAAYWMGRFYGSLDNSIKPIFDILTADSKAERRIKKERLISKIEESLNNEERGFGKRPPYVRRSLRTPTVDVRRFHGLRIAVLFDQHVYKSNLCVEDNLPLMFVEGAAALGFSAKHFTSDNVITYDWSEEKDDHCNWYSNRIGKCENADNMKRLIDEMEEYAPDIILFDCNFISSSSGISGSLLAGLAGRIDAKLVGWNGDAWNDGFIKIFDSWVDHIDLVIHSDTNREDIAGSPQRARKLLWLHHLAPLSISENPCLFSEKDEGMRFCGSVRYDRLLEILQLSILGVPIEVFGGYRLKTESLDFRSYSELMKKSSMAFCPATNGGKTMTGRFIDAVAGRALAFESSGSSSDKFFVPYANYIPYEDALSMASSHEAMSERPDLREKIAVNAYDLYQRHYSHERYWGAVLKRLFG